MKFSGFFYFHNTYGKSLGENWDAMMLWPGWFDLELLILAHYYFEYVLKIVTKYHQIIDWLDIRSGICQRSFHNLPENLFSKPKLFADCIFLFSVVYYLNTSATELNCNFKKLMNGHTSGK